MGEGGPCAGIGGRQGMRGSARAGGPSLGVESLRSHAMPHLPPIERPRTLFDRLAFWQSKRQFGEVIGPIKVMYARVPRLAFLAQKIEKTAAALSLDEDLRLLVTANAARLNGCAFCHDMKLAQGLQVGMGRDRFEALADFETSPLFTERERAALAYCSEAVERVHVSDATFARLREHFSEAEVVELTWANAAEVYFNLQTGPLGIGSDGLAARAARGR